MATKLIAVKAKAAPDAKTVKGFAAEFAAWRTGGCPGYGFHAAFKAKLTRAARRQGVGYAEFFTLVHAEAERVMAAG